MLSLLFRIQTLVNLVLECPLVINRYSHRDSYCLLVHSPCELGLGFLPAWGTLVVSSCVCRPFKCQVGSIYVYKERGTLSTSKALLPTVTWYDRRPWMNDRSLSGLLSNLDLRACLRLQHNLASSAIIANCAKWAA